MRRSRLYLALAIWSVFGVLCLISERAHGSDKPIPPGLAKVMAEGAGRIVNPSCEDVRAVVAWIGEARAVEMARGAGASEHQIDKARRCLK